MPSHVTFKPKHFVNLGKPAIGKVEVEAAEGKGASTVVTSRNKKVNTWGGASVPRTCTPRGPCEVLSIRAQQIRDALAWLNSYSGFGTSAMISELRIKEANELMKEAAEPK